MLYPIVGNEDLVRKTVLKNLEHLFPEKTAKQLYTKLFQHIQFIESPLSITCLLVNPHTDEYVGKPKYKMSDLDAVCGYYVDMLMHSDFMEPENILALLSLHYVDPPSAEAFFLGHEIFNAAFFVWIRSFDVIIRIPKFLEKTDEEYKPTMIRFLESMCIQNQPHLQELYPEYTFNAIPKEQIEYIECQAAVKDEAINEDGLNIKLLEILDRYDPIVKDVSDNRNSDSGLDVSDTVKEEPLPLQKKKKSGVNNKQRKVFFSTSKTDTVNEEYSESDKWHLVRVRKGLRLEHFDYNHEELSERMCVWSKSNKAYIVKNRRMTLQLQDRWLTRVGGYREPACTSSEVMTM